MNVIMPMCAMPIRPVTTQLDHLNVFATPDLLQMEVDVKVL